eukprot:TRINITY_DN1122_c0_g1_i1.p1 TRINITY_DN1122_c0_g1~~TRINITY_DN1122_c0_g1_i1.p1  ORF type:complete len:336 (+),score=60.71 TRINITY_DN1122_c0_g1_i1:1267-2274(+)
MSWTTWPVTFVDSMKQEIHFTQKFPLDIWYEIKLTIKSSSLGISMAGNVVWVGVDTTQLTYMGLGLTSTGSSSFSDVTLVSTSDVVITLTDCVSREELEIAIAKALSISPSQLETKSLTCVKRQSTPITATVTLSSVSGGPSGVALASQLQYLIASGSPLIFGSGLAAISASVVAPSVPSGLPVATLPTPAPTTTTTGSSSGGSSGTSAIVVGVIVGSIFGAIVLVGLAIGATIELIHKQSQKNKTGHQQLNDLEDGSDEIPLTPMGIPQPDNALYDSEPLLGSSPEEDQSSRSSQASVESTPKKLNKPRGGVDIFGREAVTSITARTIRHGHPN